MFSTAGHVTLLIVTLVFPLAIVSSPTNIWKKQDVSLGTLGLVSPVFRCGGLGTAVQLRISNCDGACEFIPGQAYDGELEWRPAVDVESLTLSVQLCWTGVGLCYKLLEMAIPNPGIQPSPGLHIAKFTIVPNAIFSGKEVEYRVNIWHTANRLMEICISADGKIL